MESKLSPVKSKTKSAGTRSKTNGANKRDILKLAKAEGVQFLRLQFTDITGVNKNIEVPASQFEKAINGEIMFDGSSIEGFVRIEESDMILSPDLDTFQVFPQEDEGGKVARLICDIYTPDGNPFPIPPTIHGDLGCHLHGGVVSIPVGHWSFDCGVDLGGSWERRPIVQRVHGDEWVRWPWVGERPGVELP